MAEDKPQRPLRISPSALTTWSECPRKWAFRHIKGIETPQAPSAALGTEVHAQLEKYMNGEPLDFTKPSGYIAASAVNLLPPPSTPDLEKEKYFTYAANDLTYHGYIDLQGPDSSVFPGIKDGNPFVSDHKTTSDIAKYAKTPEILEHDPQAIIYAQYAFRRYPDAKKVDLVWTYMATKGSRKARRVHLPILKDKADEEFSLMQLTAGQLAATYYAKTEPLALPPNTSACHLYGVCPHHPSKGGLCTDLSSINQQGIPMSEATQNMLNDLMNRLPQEEKPVTDALPSWLTAAVDPGPQVSTPANTGTDPLALLNTVPINPPGEAAPESAALLPKPTPEDKPKRTRRTKAEMEAARATDTQTPNTPVVAETIFRIQTLYVDCVPVQGGGEFLLAEEIIEEAKQVVNKQCEVADYRLLDYGKGAGALTAAVMELLDKRTSGMNIVLDSRTPEGALVLAGLLSRATRVVRGLR